MTRETQTPGRRGTKQECCLDGGEADGIALTVYIQSETTARRYGEDQIE